MAPPKKKVTPTPPLEALLDFEPEDGGTPNAPSVDDGDQEQTTEEHDNSDEAKSFEQVELETLRAQLAAANEALANAPKPAYVPVDEATLSPEQRQIRNLQDALAKAKGKDDTVQETYEENVEGGILVHFLEDGLTSNHRNFVKGQEVIFGPQAYADTLDRFGNSWLNLDDDAQYARWGKVRFRKGPWPGKREYEEPEAKRFSITAQAPSISI